MLYIERFVCNQLQENCYIIHDESREAIILDCGALFKSERQAIVNYIQQQQITPVRLIATHGHLDHNFGNAAIYQTYGLKVEAHINDAFLIEHLEEQAMQMFMMQLEDKMPPVGNYFTTDQINLGSHHFQIIHTPGHTPGGVVYYCAEEKVAFTGDTLFQMSIGRTDFEGGSYYEMISSLQLLKKLLPADTTILSGHGGKTTMADELKYNPYLK